MTLRTKVIRPEARDDPFCQGLWEPLRSHLLRGERRVPYGRSTREGKVIAVAYRGDDGQIELVRMMTMIMLSVLSTYTDRVGLLPGLGRASLPRKSTTTTAPRRESLPSDCGEGFVLVYPSRPAVPALYLR
jgi:hypothetical protein